MEVTRVTIIILRFTVALSTWSNKSKLTNKITRVAWTISRTRGLTQYKNRLSSSGKHNTRESISKTYSTLKSILWYRLSYLKVLGQVKQVRWLEGNESSISFHLLVWLQSCKFTLRPYKMARYWAMNKYLSNLISDLLKIVRFARLNIMFLKIRIKIIQVTGFFLKCNDSFHQNINL